MNLDSILSKVRGLVNKAEHPETPPAEAQACREAADRLMLKYAIDQATLRQSMPEAQRMKPSIMDIDIVEVGSPYEIYFTNLVMIICEHTRTQAVFFGLNYPSDLLEYYDKYSNRPQIRAKIYGFEADLKYFEILYTTLLLHMSNGIDPKINPALSDDENSYNLRMAGYQWADIARMFYAKGHEFGWDGVANGNGYMKFTGYWKRAANREAARRGEKHVHIPAKKNIREIWRKNFARSYTSTLRVRLANARNSREVTGELVLRADMDAIRALLEKDNPNLKTSAAIDDTPYNDEAWKAGDRHAASADLNYFAQADSNSRHEIG